MGWTGGTEESGVIRSNSGSDGIASSNLKAAEQERRARSVASQSLSPATAHYENIGHARVLRRLFCLDWGVGSVRTGRVRTTRRLVRTPAAQHGQRRFDKQREVGQIVLVVDVPDVHANPILEANVGATTDLPQARQAGADC